MMAVLNKYSLIIISVLLICVKCVNNLNDDQSKSITQEINVLNCASTCLRQYDKNSCKFASSADMDVSCEYSCIYDTDCEATCTCLKNITDETLDDIELTEYSTLELYCRKTNKLVFKWNTQTSFMYILSLENTISDEKNVIVVNESMHGFTNLVPNTTYNLGLWTLMDRDTLIHETIIKDTLSETHRIAPVATIWIENFTSVEYDGVKTCEVDVHWSPSPDLTCQYGILLLWDSNSILDEKISEDELYKYTLTQLNLAENYSVAVVAISSNLHKSTRTWLSFTTPTCTEIYENLKECPPEKPQNLQVTVSNCTNYIYNHSCNFDMLIKWEKPKLIPDNYTIFVKVWDRQKFMYEVLYNTNITGTSTNIIIENLIFMNSRSLYEIIITAYSEGGQSRSSKITQVSQNLSDSTWTKSEIVNLIVVIIFLLLFVGTLSGLIIFFYFHRKKNKSRFEQKYFKELEVKSQRSEDLNIVEQKQNIYSNDVLEIPRSHLVLHTVLGKGAFGVVRRGFLVSKHQEVAVKMLKEDASAEDIHQFKQEINTMKSIDSHPYLVSMVGYCTKNVAAHQIWLIVEYCALGDLQGYLQKFWNRLQTFKIPLQAVNLKTNDTFETLYCNFTSNVFNQAYGIDDNNPQSNTKDYVLTTIDLLSFSRQIALGMEYLSSNRIVHRDLAARNVLVTANRTMKIADFGLSRDIYQENIYKKVGNGKLPIKWMALESLTHQLYTTQSDVWSFGILLWEMITLGGNPYPSIPTSRLLKLLQTGYRMECPINCSSELYGIMLSCWNAVPKERPTFGDLCSSLETLLEAATPDKYLSLDVLVCDDNFHNTTPENSRESEESKENRYLTPY